MAEDWQCGDCALCGVNPNFGPCEAAENDPTFFCPARELYGWPGPKEQEEASPASDEG